MSEFNFKSRVCTDKIQSERLLALGLKKETADCYWWQENDQYGDGNGKWHLEVLDTKEAREHFEYLDKIFDDELFIPAWSLHRLIEMMPPSIRNTDHYGLIYDIHRDWVCYMSYAQGRKCPYNKIFFESQSTKCYDAFIDCIEWLIANGYFNKGYLI